MKVMKVNYYGQYIMVIFQSDPRFDEFRNSGKFDTAGLAKIIDEEKHDKL